MTESKIQPAFSRMRPNAKLTDLLAEIVEGFDLGVAEDAVVYAEVVEGAVQVIFGARLGLAEVKQSPGGIPDSLVDWPRILGPVYVSKEIPPAPGIGM